ENRAIAESRPLYNRRSKPPKSLHWVKLTNERFPRLSIARSPGDSAMVLGPFRTRRSAIDVMHGLWDATRIRRCTSPGNGCDFAQLGQAVCTCDGSISTAAYAAIVNDLFDGVQRPAALVEVTRARMERLSALQRFEDAAAVRDRWTSLTAAIHRRRVWQAFQESGRIEASDPEGVSLLITHGRMVTAWPSTDTLPLTLAPTTRPLPHPPSMAAIDEAMLLWKWLGRTGVRIVSVGGTLALPAWKLPGLADRRQQEPMRDTMTTRSRS
ncbi:MAG: hypothetical protein ABFR53_08120, partial [Actinomycetota bacterium]